MSDEQEKVICPHCGFKFRVEESHADRVSIHGMYDCHLFHKIPGQTVDEVILNWLLHNSRKSMAEREDGTQVDLGPSMLGPAIVLCGKTELRRVGDMVFPDYKTGAPKDLAELMQFRDALLADPDISRLLAEREKDETFADDCNSNPPRCGTGNGTPSTGAFPFE